MNYFTGIGSRQTPPEVCDWFTDFSYYVTNSNVAYTLRSGGADGADKAFEKRAIYSEIYVPWLGFNGSKSTLLPTTEAFEIASVIHPVWNKLSDAAKKLHARNIHQVLGKDLKTPSQFVLCWTVGGETVGGTATAIKVANKYDVPVFNAGKYDNVLTMSEACIDFLILNSII